MPAKLEENRSLVELSYKLATIKTDLVLPFDIGNIPKMSLDEGKLLEIYTELEFKAWTEELGNKRGQFSTETSVSELKLMRAKNHSMLVVKSIMKLFWSSLILKNG